jgi:hypothetical protein
MKKLVLIFILFLTGCNIGVNTSDPQASQTIKASQKDKLFIKAFKVDTIKSSLFIDEAWIEFSWRNKVKYGKVFKFRPGGIQLVLKFNPKTFSLDPYKYLLNWEFIDSIYGPLASYDGLYTLELNEKVMPTNFEIYLQREHPDTVRLGKIYLVAQTSK